MLIRQLPRDSALVRAKLGDAAPWGLLERLVARVEFQLAGANWQRSGGKGARPQPVRPPDTENTKRWGTSRPLGEVREMFARWREGDLT